jgi:phosphate-selective porin OprO/OprP
MTSSNYVTFIERSLPTILSPDRQTGFMLFNTALDDRIYGAVGVFRQTGDTGKNVDDGGYDITGRVAALPIYENKGASVLQVGAAYSFRNPDDSLQIRQRPEAHLANYIVDTGTLACDRENLIGLESAWVNGPLSMQAEYTRAGADLLNGSDASFDGYYVEGSYFLTGEHKNYNTKEAVFGRVKPNKNYSFGGSPGAWELKARYSELDLNNGDISGGKVNDITAGANWYLNPNTRLMWDYVHADKEDSGQADMLMMRLQFDF